MDIRMWIFLICIGVICVVVCVILIRFVCFVPVGRVGLVSILIDDRSMCLFSGFQFEQCDDRRRRIGAVIEAIAGATISYL